MHRIRMDGLPVVTLVWTDEETVVGGGHDCRPRVFSGSRNGWALTGTLDDGQGAAKATEGGTVGRLKAGAFARFREADSRGQRAGMDTKIGTVHQNTITSVRGHGAGRVSTSGVDGKVVVWVV